MSYKLYTWKGNPNADKALIVAEYVGIKIELPEFQLVSTVLTGKHMSQVVAAKIVTGILFAAHECLQHDTCSV